MSLTSYYLLVTSSNLSWDTMKRKYTKEEIEKAFKELEDKEATLQELISLKEQLGSQLESQEQSRENLKVEYENQIEKYQMQIENLTNENLEVQQQLIEKKRGEKIFIHPAFRDRIFEICCTIGMEHYMFGQITKSQLVEEKLLRLKKMDNVYKNANEATKRRIEEEVKKKAIEFFEDYYKSHGLFIIYGDVETILSDNRSKVLGLEETEQKLLNQMLPGRLFLDESTKEYLKEISFMDGAVCVDSFGMVQAAARYLIIDRELTLTKVPIYKGFGTKNVTAQCITEELDDIVAYTISGRSKLIRQFEHGEMVREFNPIIGKLSLLENGEIVEQCQFSVKSYFKGSEEINEHIDLIYQLMEEQLGQKNKDIVESVMYKLHKITQHRHVASKQFYLKDGRKIDSLDKNIEETHVPENGYFLQLDMSEEEEKNRKEGAKKKGGSSRKKKTKKKIEEIEVTT